MRGFQINALLCDKVKTVLHRVPWGQKAQLQASSMPVQSHRRLPESHKLNFSVFTWGEVNSVCKLCEAKLRSTQEKENLAFLHYKKGTDTLIFASNTQCAVKQIITNLRERMATRHKVKHVHRHTVFNTQHI